jgi:hypothetical protein
MKWPVINLRNDNQQENEKEIFLYEFTLLNCSVGGSCWSLFSVRKLNSCMNWNKHVTSVNFYIQWVTIDKVIHKLTIGTVGSCLMLRKTPISPLLENICTKFYTVASTADRTYNREKKGKSYLIQIMEKWRIQLETFIFSLTSSVIIIIVPLNLNIIL